MTIAPADRRLYGTLLKQHPAERTLLLAKADMVRAMRGWLHETGYTEVATPVLCQDRESAPIPQFATRHPLTGQSFHLRHSAEEHLRRVVVSIDRVFDLSKAIRAEQADDSHAIEFTMLQTAARDIDLQTGISLVTSLVQHTVQTTFATLATPAVDFTTIRTRTVDDAIAEALGVTEAPTGAELVAAARGWLKDRGLEADGTDWAVMEDFVKHAVEKPVTQPTVLYGFPWELRHNSRINEASGRAERFSLIAAGTEICDGGVKLRTADDYRPMVEANITLRTQLHGIPADQGPVDFFTDIDCDPADVFTFGLGVERLLALCTGRTVFEALTFPYH
ncbi:amino acid--tRNA ligase-related protein [Streptomyces sp. NBC_00239]|uniref:amino acid--tRNA ligase-related protein n=1 Tax=Streptomyces sp. NBC_00239 TaxID=2903640 RepID=UPI002E2E1981|nr:amino acid--tRNA ligase-related protein [Streptomyces sp. NBC_00239]